VENCEFIPSERGKELILQKKQINTDLGESGKTGICKIFYVQIKTAVQVY